jgi:nicotinate-nucleotide--dimethylbenzimidazole phosphoribosyltransferase
MDSPDLAAIAERISRPDDRARVAARERLRDLAPSHPSGLGRLGDLASWLAGGQGTPELRPVDRTRLLVVAADHGIAAADVSLQPAGATAGHMRALLSGSAPAAGAARVTGTALRVVDAGVDAGIDAGVDTGALPAEVIGASVRRGSGRIDREDALRREDAERLFEAGRRLAGTEADEGTQLLLVAAIGRAATTPAAAVVGALLGGDAASLVGRSSRIDDRTWMRKCGAVRDALRRARRVAGDPLGLLATAGGPDLALITGLLLQAAARRTPVVLDGLVPVTAAVVAHRIAPAAADWWLAADRYSEPAYGMALDVLAMEPLLSLGLERGDGLAAALTVPMIRAAAALLGERPWSPD